MTPTVDSAGGRLECQQVLYPPSKQVGTGENSLHYASSSTAWQCTFSPDGQLLVACFGAPDPCIRVWRRLVVVGKDDKSESWQLSETLKGVHERTIRSIAFAPIAQPETYVLAAASFDGSVSVWEFSTTSKGEWECTAQLEGHENEVKCVTWNGSGSLLASCGRDKTVWIWECFLPSTVGGPDLPAGDGGDFDCIAVLAGHEGDVKSIRFAPSHGQWGDGDEILLSTSYDDTVKCWAEDAGEWYCAASLESIHASTVWCLALAPGGARLVSGSADGSLAILKSYTTSEAAQLFPNENTSEGLWKCVGKLPHAHSLPIYSLDYAPSRVGHGRIVSGGGDNRIQIYREALESNSNQPLFSLDASVTTTHGDVNSVCWHPWDGSVLASVGDDGTMCIWKYSFR